MKKYRHFRYFKTSADVIRLALMHYVGIVRLNDDVRPKSPNLVKDWANFPELLGKQPNTYFENQPKSAIHHSKSP